MSKLTLIRSKNNWKLLLIATYIHVVNQTLGRKKTKIKPRFSYEIVLCGIIMTCMFMLDPTSDEAL